MLARKMTRAAPSPIARLGEYFTLRRATQTAGDIPESSRTEISTNLAIGRQRSEAADALWSSGHTAEGLRLAAEAFRYTAAAAQVGPETTPVEKAPTDETSADAVPAEVPAADLDQPEKQEEEADRTDSSLRSILRNRNLSDRRIDRILETQASLERATLPVLNANLSVAHSTLYEDLAFARDKIDSAIELTALSPRELRRTRASRHVLSGGLIIVAATLAFFVFRTPPRTEFSSSETYPGFLADNGADGDPATEWLLPDNQTGWMEIVLEPSRHIDKVRLLNAHNRQFNDRATRQYRIEFYADGELIGSRAGNFTELDATPEWTEVEAGFDQVDTVRFVVLSFFGSGGGLAELELQ